MKRSVRITAGCACLAALFLMQAACAGGMTGPQAKEEPVAARPIDEVLRENVRALMAIPGVAGAGQGLCDGKPCIRVYVTEKTPQLERDLPRTLEGYPVEIVETGQIRALPKEDR